MLKKIFFIFLQFYVLGQVPNWVKDTSLICTSRDICAVGEGLSVEQSHRNARVSLSKYFNSQISSKFNSTLSNVGSDIIESMNEEISEITYESLEGVEILKTHESKTGFYSLAKLDRIKTANALENKIHDLDSRITILINEDSANSLVRADSLIYQREQLNNRYYFLLSKNIATPYSIESTRKVKLEKLKDIFLVIKIDEISPKEIKSVIIDAFSKLGYQISGEISSDKKSYVIDGEVNYRQEYLNVEGFVKYKITISLRSLNSGVQKGSVLIEHTQTGRNLTQVIELSKEEIRTKIKAEISNLKI